MPTHQELFQKYRIDRTPAAFEELVRACRPLVASVCWRYLRRPEDADDAIQETFLKLAANVGNITGDVSSWLTATAYAASVDLIRRAARERRRRAVVQSRSQATFDLADAQRHAVHELVRLRLSDALLVLDEISRDLIIERFFRKTPLRVIAGRSGASVATISRRTQSSVGNLLIVLREMGITSLDERTLTEHMGDSVTLTAHLGFRAAGEQLRFAPDWRAPLFAPAGPQAVGSAGPFWPGWSRRIRVGVLTSYLSSITPGSSRGARHDIEVQVRSTEYLENPAFQLIGIAEPGTTDRGPVERVLRNYELTGGLIEATDAEALKSLDVILLGTVFAIDPAVAEAFVSAVRSGVGLLNEWWTGGVTVQSDPNVRSLMLAESPVQPVHVDPYCVPAIHQPATVRQSHALLPGLHVGDRLMVAACGPLYHPLPEAHVLIEKDHVVPAKHHRIPGLGPTRMPAYVVGRFGRGRVVAALVRMMHGHFAPALSVGAKEYFENLFAWLAEPRREL